MSADFNIFLEYTGKSGKKEIRILKNLKVFSKYEDRPEGEEVLHILDINDLHGAAPGYGDDVISGVSRHNPGLIRIADQMGETLRDYPGSIVLSAGDNATGDAFSTAMHGKSLFPVEKSLGVQYSAVGNHEFD
ncbi:MAG: hypothetical protein MJ201_01820 [Mycoplasmoidaceae bacterium]|nr:hypothetical protein [Mycoplasmoidaceae bacterium]